MLFFIVSDEFQINKESLVEACTGKIGLRKFRECLFIEGVLEMFELYR